MAFTELLERAGGVGLFQTLQVLTLLLASVFLPPQILLDNFSAATPGHRCWAHMLDNGSEAPLNLTPEALMVISIPLGPNHKPHQCRRFRQPQWHLLEPNATATNWSEAATELCVDGWVYDRSAFASTIVAEWGLVCDKQGLKPLGQAVFMAGNLLGSLAWGLLSSWLGRKPMLSWCCLQVAVANTGAIFAPNFLVYCGLRFVCAFGLAGIILTSTALMVEWTTTRRRAVTMTILGCAYCTGQMLLGGLAFALRDWRTLHLAVSTPFFAIFLISWWLPESARWLIITGKADQALQELRKVARINGHREAKKTLTMEALMSCVEEEAASAEARRSLLALFQVPTLRRRSCCLMVVKYAPSPLRDRATEPAAWGAFWLGGAAPQEAAVLAGRREQRVAVVWRPAPQEVSWTGGQGQAESAGQREGPGPVVAGMDPCLSALSPQQLTPRGLSAWGHLLTPLSNPVRSVHSHPHLPMGTVGSREASNCPR